MLQFEDLISLLDGHARVDVPCPICSHLRKASHRRLKVLRIWDDGEILTYNCAHCGIHGYALEGRSRSTEKPKREPKPAPPEPDKGDLARYLWASSVPLEGTPVETYLEARKCPVVSDQLRYLPPRGDYPHAMLAQFWGAAAIHMTKLNADGTGKAGTDKDKIMIGPSLGHPIKVYDPDEREELIITEGIEDAASFAIAMGWPTWAAGSASRVPSCLPPHGRVYVAVDDDTAGWKALAAAQKIRSVIPIRVGRIFRGMDANKLLMTYGTDALVAVVEWSDAQYAYEHGEIHRAAYENALAFVEKVTG